MLDRIGLTHSLKKEDPAFLLLYSFDDSFTVSTAVLPNIPEIRCAKRWRGTEKSDLPLYHKDYATSRRK